MSVKGHWPRPYKGEPYRENFDEIRWEPRESIGDEWNGTCPMCGGRAIEEGGDYYLKCLKCGNQVSWN